MIAYTGIQPKPYKRFGQLYTPKETLNTYHAEVEPGKSLRLYGIFRNCTGGPRPFDHTFHIGDWCEYDSYNTSYHGHITAIGKNTVTVQPEHDCHNARRLDLYEFSWRNWDFDLEKSRKENNKWLD